MKIFFQSLWLFVSILIEILSVGFTIYGIVINSVFIVLTGEVFTVCYFFMVKDAYKDYKKSIADLKTIKG